jgi:outer membrane protein TolC
LPVLALVLAVFASAASGAAEPPPAAGTITLSSLPAASNSLGLADLARQLISSNPQLQSARYTARANRLGVGPAGAPDNPTITLNQDPLRNSPLAFNTSQGASWTVSQNLYWPGKKSLASEVVSAQASATEAQVDSLQSQLLGQLRATWLAWQASQAQLRLIQTQIARLEQVKEITRVRYAQNAAAFADFINAQVTQEQLRTTSLTTQLQADTQMAQLAALVGHASPTPLAVRVEQLSSRQDVPAVETFREQALERHPLLKASAAAVQAAQRSVDLAELATRPDFNLALTGHAANPPWGLANTPTYGVAVGMTVPLWYARKEKLLIDQAKAQLSAARDADESQRQQALLGVNAAWLQWSQSLEQLRLVEGSLLEQARLAYRLTLTNYSAGQVPYVDVLNAFNTERGVELMAVQARSSALSARVALDAAVGETLLPSAF